MGEAEVVDVTEKYYDSDEADRFYYNVWGGEDIHIGLYRPGDTIRDASARTVETMADELEGIGATSRVLDLGAGYGGSARYLAKRFGCHVSCLNISETQNERNRQMSKEQGLADRIDVVHGNFEELPFDDDSFDFIWSQDSFLHSGKRQQILREARRVIRTGGHLVFTDPMQADDCPADVLQPVLDRIHLESLASFDFYKRAAPEAGFEEVRLIDLTEQLGNHYGNVRENLRKRYDEMIELCSKEYVDRMIAGLGHWVDAESKGYLAWGILHFQAV